MTGPLFAVTGWARWDAESPGWEGPPADLGSVRREEPAVEVLTRLGRRCLDAAGLGAGDEVGVAAAVGCAVGEIQREHARAVLSGEPSRISARTFIYTTPNTVTARVSILLGLDGESLTLPDPAAPFWAAADLLAEGRAEAVLAGGVSVREGDEGHPKDLEAALLCLARPPREDRGPTRGWLTLEPPSPDAGHPGPDEGAVATALCRLLDQSLGGEVDCGRRGRILLTTGVPSARERP